MATIDEIVKNYEPNLGGQVLFTIPAPDGGPGNTIDVNTLSEQAVDQLIQQYGGHGPLIGRKNYLQAKRQQNEAANPTVDPYNKYLGEAEKRATGLQEKLDQIFSDQAEYGTQLIDQGFAPERSKAVSEEAALGRLRSPVSLSAGAPIDRVDTARRNAKTSLFSNIANNRAGAQTDIAKTIEQIFGNQQALGLSNEQFGQTMDWNKNKYQAEQDNRAEIRRLFGMTGSGGEEEESEDIGGGALSGAISGASTGSAAGPWGALIGGVAGAGLGAYGGTKGGKKAGVDKLTGAFGGLGGLFGQKYMDKKFPAKS